MSTEELIKLARANAMSEEDKYEQMVSFVYGNLAIDDPTVTRESVEKILSGFGIVTVPKSSTL